MLKSHPAYGWDLTKNICELYGSNGYIRTAYTYTPYGEVTASGDVTQPIQWSSEYNDTELGLVYYNYRHYNPLDGRWTGRDFFIIVNRYVFANNNPFSKFDYIGDSTAGSIIIAIGIAALSGVAIYEYIKYRANVSNGEINIYAMKFPSKYDMERYFAELNTGRKYYDETVFSLEELKSTMKSMQDMMPCKCIKKLKIAAHGFYYDDKDRAQLAIGDNKYYESEQEKDISSIFADVTFCKNCSIELVVCHIGSSKLLYERLKKHKCKVKLYDYEVSPSV